MTVGLLLFASMNSLWMFYLASTVIALGQGMGSGVAFPTAAMHWFVRKRGRAYSILAMGRAWGYIGVFAITWLLVAFEWRQAAAIAALAFCAVNLTMAQVLRRRPQDYGYLPDGDRVPGMATRKGISRSVVSDDASFTIREALRTNAFWLVLISTSLYGFCNHINLVHQIPALRSVGYSAKGAATVVAIFGGIQVAGRLSAGWIGDKIGRHRLLTISYPLLGAGWLFFANISPGRLWYTAPYLLSYSLGQSANTVMSQTVVADFFGTRRYATIRGLISSMSLVLGVTGPIFAGMMFDASGSYHLTFLILAPIIFLGTPAIMLAGKPKLAGPPTLTPESRVESSTPAAPDGGDS